MTAASMLAAARRDLGLVGRPNRITRYYAARHGDVYLSAPWCDMSVTWWARQSGNASAVLPAGDRAYTVAHAEDGRKIGRWYAGTVANIIAHAVPGAVIFFDWEGQDGTAPVDHVGVVELVLKDGRVQTIEGNTSNAVKRRVRAANVIAGFFVPAYDSPKKPKPPKPKPVPADPTEALVNKLPTLRPGDHGWHVKTLVHLLAARDHAVPDGVDDTVMSPAVVVHLKGFQKAAGLKDTGVADLATWAKLLRLA